MALCSLCLIFFAIESSDTIIQVDLFSKVDIGVALGTKSIEKYISLCGGKLGIYS